MRARTVAVLTMALSLAAFNTPQPAHAAEPSKGAPAIAQIDTAVVAKLFEAFGVVALSGTQDCTNMDPCTVTITMFRITYSGKDYCAAQLLQELDYHSTASGNTDKTIIFKLDNSGLGGAAAEFHDGNGILPIANLKNQLNPDNRRTSKTEYHAKNKHKQTDTMTYVPIVYWTVNGLPELCAAADPKIVNN
jgi:hypothetical protein